jgi:hypothetical protein
MRTAALIVAVAVAALSAQAASSTSLARGPAPLRGVPLERGTALRLLVADNPPFVLDVDSGTVTPVAGIPPITRGTLSVVGVGGRSGVVIARSQRNATLYGVRGGQARVATLGHGTNTWPAASGDAVWVQSRRGHSPCRLRRVGLDGRVLDAPRAFPCATTNDPAGGSLGLVANRTRVIDPLTGRTVLRTRNGIVAVAGKSVLLRGPGKQLALLDTATDRERRFRWPSILEGLDRPAVDPRGRFIAIAFADPAWQGGGNQAADVWVLDTRTRALTQLPGLPAFVSLKFTDIEWADDGRLVILGESARKAFVAVWRPGRKRLALKTIRLPERNSGSDTFAPLR